MLLYLSQDTDKTEVEIGDNLCSLLTVEKKCEESCSVCFVSWPSH